MTKEGIEKNQILKLCFDFSLMIIAFCERLDLEKKYVVSRQLLKSGTSIRANAMEAQNAESVADFIHKFKIAAKEAEETEYWLLLCACSKNYPDPGILLTRIEEINRVLGKIISSAKKSSSLSNPHINKFANPLICKSELCQLIL